LPAFGVGPPIAPEWAATGREVAGSGALVDEALDIMTRLWSGERVTVAGRFFRYTDVRIAPLPVQSPLPLWVGGRSRAAVRRPARIGTGWLGGVESPEQVAGVVAAIKAEAAATGRAIDLDHFGAAFAFRFGSSDEPLVQRTGTVLAALAGTDDPRRHVAGGGARGILARLEGVVSARATEFVLRPIAPREGRVLDQARPPVPAGLAVV